jgi:hypothetical protein
LDVWQFTYIYLHIEAGFLPQGSILQMRSLQLKILF